MNAVSFFLGLSILTTASVAFAAPPAALPSGASSRDVLAAAKTHAVNTATARARTGREAPGLGTGAYTLPSPALHAKNFSTGPGAKWSWTGSDSFGKKVQQLDHEGHHSRTVQYSASGLAVKASVVRQTRYETPSGTLQTETKASTRDVLLSSRGSERTVETHVAHDQTKTTTEIDIKGSSVRSKTNVRVTISRPGEAPVTAEATATTKRGEVVKVK